MIVKVLAARLVNDEAIEESQATILLKFQEMYNLVLSFYESEVISKQLPGRKDSIKVNGSFRQKSLTDDNS